MPEVLKLTREFVRNPGHRYNIDAEVFSAKFGRTQVDIWLDKEPSRIWRGEPKIIVAELAQPLWRIVVRGELSSCALTEEVAKAEGERYAWNSEANWRSGRPVFHYGLSTAAMRKHAEDFQAMIDDTMRRFPADFIPVQQRPSAAPSMAM